MLYQLTDFETGYTLGIVKVIDSLDYDYESILEEIQESWSDFNEYEEHELNPQSVIEFVIWHNENWLIQIERVFTEVI